MKRLIKKASSNKDKFDSIIDELMSQDHNGSWDELWNDVAYERDLTDENQILKICLDELIESVQNSMHEYESEGDEDIYKFYYDIKTQCEQLKLSL